MLHSLHFKALFSEYSPMYTPQFLKGMLDQDLIVAALCGMHSESVWTKEQRLSCEIVHKTSLEQLRSLDYWIDPDIKIFFSSHQREKQVDTEEINGLQDTVLSSACQQRLIILTPAEKQKILNKREFIPNLSDAFYAEHASFFYDVSPIIWINHGYLYTFKKCVSMTNYSTLLLERSIQLGHLEIGAIIYDRLSQEGQVDINPAVFPQNPNKIARPFYQNLVESQIKKGQWSDELSGRSSEQESRLLYGTSACLEADRTMSDTYRAPLRRV